jgi:glutamate-1-semialdehyde 2,1-aminomutase
MDLLAPSGPVYQAGTYAAHPHAMAAGVAVLERLSPDVYATLEATAARLADGLVAAAKDAGCEATVVRAGTFLSVFFTGDAPRDLAEVSAADRSAFGRFHREMRERGVLIAPSPFEAWFPSLAHTADEVDATVDAAHDAFRLATGR